VDAEAKTNSLDGFHYTKLTLLVCPSNVTKGSVRSEVNLSASGIYQSLKLQSSDALTIN
jgi:hypothetical protein